MIFAVNHAYRERDVRLDQKLEHLRNSLSEKTKRPVDLAAEKGVSI